MKQLFIHKKDKKPANKTLHLYTMNYDIADSLNCVFNKVYNEYDNF